MVKWEQHEWDFFWITNVNSFTVLQQPPSGNNVEDANIHFYIIAEHKPKMLIIFHYTLKPHAYN